MRAIFDLENTSIMIYQAHTNEEGYYVLLTDVYGGSFLNRFFDRSSAIQYAFNEALLWYENILEDFLEMDETEPLTAIDYITMAKYPLTLLQPYIEFEQYWERFKGRVRLKEMSALYWRKMMQAKQQ